METLNDKQNIVLPLGDTNFIFLCWKEILSIREDKNNRLSVPPCNILHLSAQVNEYLTIRIRIHVQMQMEKHHAMFSSF